MTVEYRAGVWEVSMSTAAHGKDTASRGFGATFDEAWLSMNPTWADEISKKVCLIRSRATNPLCPLPADVCELQGGWASLQQLIARFAEVLCWWPSIVEKTKALRAKGEEMGAPLS